ncbi:hypothetical protein WMY93_022869 [Mugilogobius chulae]|uniref:Reelin n=1 Tax=Mugilogobius chulae TaxID=88201 RepID=A0AAW0N3S0_9GOBI
MYELENCEGTLFKFRWWQPYHSGRGHDVWAVDEISMTSVLFNTISLDFSNVLDVTQSLGFYLGHVQPYCQHDWTLSFSGEPSPGSSIRYVETQSMQVGASYSLQFSLVMAVVVNPRPHRHTGPTGVSTNHGLTWHLVKEIESGPALAIDKGGSAHQTDGLPTNRPLPPGGNAYQIGQRQTGLSAVQARACLPGMPSCSEFTAPSVYHPSEFKDWRRITLSLPQKTWSSATRFRWIQNYYGEQDEWALDDIYIASSVQACATDTAGVTRTLCDDGFTGADCQPSSPLSSSVLSDFESQDALLAMWQEVIGGEAGLRQLVSWDLDTEWAEFVQFYLRVGGDWAECNQADSREEGVLLQYSTTEASHGD